MEMVPMKLPTTDNDLTEDEIEGLVVSSSNNDSNGFGSGSKVQRRNQRSGRGTYSSSPPFKLSTKRKCFIFLAIIVISGALVSLTASDEKGVHDATKNSMGDDMDDEHPDKFAYGKGKYNKGGKGDDKDNNKPNNVNVNQNDTDESGDGLPHTDDEADTLDDTTDDDTTDNGESEGDGDDGDDDDDAVDGDDEDMESGNDSAEEEEDDDATDDAEGDDDKGGDIDDTIEDDEEDDDEDGDDNESEDEEVDTEVDADEEAKKEAMIEKWGKWHFWDGDPDSRPTEDYLAKYPNRDCPFDEFPYTAWQGDAVYVNHMLDSAGELVDRAKEAIYTEYGWGPLDDITREQRIERRKMFHLELLDLEDPQVKEPKDSYQQGGWTTRKSFEGLARRLLHAMMTNDTFTVVLGGHSAAAGHGNLFLQSYMMQFHHVLEPIFDRLGVKLITRNLARGGLGTLQDSLGSGSLYGDEVDMILWDSSMTENDKTSPDLFFRQALIGGNRAPVLMAWNKQFENLKTLHLGTDADILCPGNGMYGIPETSDVVQAETLPFATRYMKCGVDNKSQCTENEHKFRANCWIEREDVTPPRKQDPRPGSQVGWHPGFRSHQLHGRALAMIVLDALQDAIDIWSEITIVEGHPLADEYWHVTDMYENIKSKALNLEKSHCNEIKEHMPERVCSTPLKGRTEFTPRANPEETSLVSLLKPTPDGYIPKNEQKMLYDGPDVPNPMLMPPEGEIDVRAIVSNRRKLSAFEPFTPMDLNERFLKQEQQQLSSVSSPSMNMPLEDQHSLRGRNLSEIRAGKGWIVDANPGHCDGTSTGYCGRKSSSTCLLSGHSDYRGGILGDALSGWLVMNIPKVEAGLIMVKFESWHLKRESIGTKGWKEINDGEYDRARGLKEVAPPLPDDFFFDYAINGEVTSLGLEEFNDARKIPQRVVEIITILDDPEMETMENLEVAFRLRNCGRDCVFKFTHLYWA